MTSLWWLPGVPVFSFLASIYSSFYFVCVASTFLCLCFPGGATRSVDRMESTERKLLPSLAEFYDKEIEVDVCLHSQDDDFIWCHSIVASANSPYIEQCIDQGSRFKDADDGTSWNIKIYDINIDIVSRIVNYFYTGKIIIMSSDVPELLLAARILRIDCLVVKLYDIVHKMLCIDNYITFLDFSKKFKLSMLQNVCYKFMHAALPELIATNAIAALSTAHLRSFANDYMMFHKKSKDILDSALENWFVRNSGLLCADTILRLMDVYKFEPCTIDRTDELFDYMARKVDREVEKLSPKNGSLHVTDERIESDPLHDSQVC